MKQLEIVDGGVVFRNPLPGHKVISAFFPHLHVQSDSEWLCVLRTGGAMYSRDGMLELFRTTDQGKTWTREGPLRDRAADGLNYNYRVGHTTTLRDGTLAVGISRVPHEDEDQLLLDADTGGWLPHEFCVLRSDDGGRTWGDPVVAELAEPFGPGVEAIATGCMIELDEGLLFQAFETWKTYENQDPFDLQTYGLFSRDGGSTWGDRVAIAHGGSARSYSHGRPIRLSDGRLLVVLWTAEAHLEISHDLHAAVSTDASGTEWSEPRSLGIHGQTNWPVELTPGCLALVYSHREETDQPGIKVVLSTDGGDTWDLDRQVTAWDAYGKEALGVPRTDTYPSSHDAIAYGAPQATRLNDAELLVGFWCTQGADTHCRWCRVRVV